MAHSCRLDARGARTGKRERMGCRMGALTRAAQWGHRECVLPGVRGFTPEGSAQPGVYLDHLWAQSRRSATGAGLRGRDHPAARHCEWLAGPGRAAAVYAALPEIRAAI